MRLLVSLNSFCSANDFQCSAFQVNQIFHESIAPDKCFLFKQKVSRYFYYYFSIKKHMLRVLIEVLLTSTITYVFMEK